MMPSRVSRPTYTSGQSSGIRKSRLENKPSMLPVPCRGSTDRTSSDAWRPSGARSSSAEPPRGFGGARSSRDASATKLSTNRARSQTSEHRYGPMATPTPQRGTQYSRITATPSRTPDDRSSRSWENCLERVLAFVTLKDPRCISNVAWQRVEYARVCSELTARNAGNTALVRPLTIARFVDIVAELLNSIIGEPKLSTDNYVTKLPHLAKRLLYPSPVSKSWLKTVNTLHAFPQALALIGYLLDMAIHCEDPVLLDNLYLSVDEQSCLRRRYLMQCWIRFQQPEGTNYDDLYEEYLSTLRATTGHDDGAVQQLLLEIKEYERGLEDVEEMAARADEARRVERRDELTDELRSARAARCAAAADIAAHDAAARDLSDGADQRDAEIERASAELGRMRVELEQQPMSVEERAKLLDQVDYATRVHDSKRALADQINKMVVSKETELAQWQKRTLDVCVEYKQGLIQLSAQLPALAGLAFDEKELMGAQCGEHMVTAVERLRAEGAKLAARMAELQCSRSALSRQRAALMDETRAKIADVKQKIQRKQQATQEELAQEAAEAAAWRLERQRAAARLEQLRANREQYAEVDAELHVCEKQEALWRKRLEEMRACVLAQRKKAQERLEAVRANRAARVLEVIAMWRDQLKRCT